MKRAWSTFKSLSILFPFSPKTAYLAHRQTLLSLICVKLCGCSVGSREGIKSVGKMMQRDEVLTDRLQKHVERLGGDIGERNVFVPDALESAAQYIEDEWREQGYTVERLEYDVFGIRCANLTATRGGSARQTEILLLGAHYDSVMGSPGANDNASGVAALLEISRMFQMVEPILSVRFVAFVNEEPPFFRSIGLRS